MEVISKVSCLEGNWGRDIVWCLWRVRGVGKGFGVDNGDRRGVRRVEEFGFFLVGLGVFDV